ncbi:sodium/hydrogen exchanger 9-like isoform X1 [Oreochromis aureus]|uniref:sodium/hydrogen exchanger 9-like isoform X1 n=2 Tax=Oreochromis aureus TaxID=47969 RepID=UPI0012BC813A|nr:sodium/hydrogen exchanger 9-like isoform X1 [Oreochromis aureus]
MMSGAMQQKQDNVALPVFAAVTLALITILSVWKLKQFKYKLVNEAGVAMFYGLLLGLTVRLIWTDKGEQCPGNTTATNEQENTSDISMVNITPHGYIRNDKRQFSSHPEETFDLQVLFNLFLPPIIFHGAYTLNQKRFIANLGSVLTYAFAGTIISCMCIGACMYGFTKLMPPKEEFLLTHCLLFGAIMSATDPVSVLGLLSDLRVDLDLHMLLFGESVLNDAVAIVLTHAITTYTQMDAGLIFDPTAFLHAFVFFLGVLIGSFLLGLIFTVITALLTKFTRLHENPLLETSVFFLLSWSSYLSAEACGLSGIVAVMFCGLSQARYTVLNLSSEGRARIKQLFEVFNFLGEISIFGYMGYILLKFTCHKFEPVFISGALLSVFLSRAFNIYPLSFLLNLGRTNKIPCKFQHFMMFAGLRGAVAFRLAVKNTATEVTRTIFTTTLLMIGFTIWVLGTAADPMLRRLDIRVGVDPDENQEDHSFEIATERPDTTQGLWHSLDYKYLKPVLTHCGPPLTESLPQCCGIFARVFSSPRVQEDEEEELCEIEAGKNTLDLGKTESQQGSSESDSASEHQEDLLDGDLGLGTAPVHPREASGSSTQL